MKRFRDENDHEPQETEYDYKKPRTLPFRTSPTVKHTLLFSKASPRSRPRPFLTSDITPVESSEDEDQQPPYPSSSPPCAQSSSQITTRSSPPYELSVGFHVDSDMDMIDSQPLGSPLPWSAPLDKMTTPHRSSQSTLVPGILQRDSQDTALGGRVPTPRWGHFRALDTNVDMLDAPANTSASTSLHKTSIIQPQISNVVSFQAAHATPTYDNAVNLSQSQLETDHSLFLRRRRLPSPISEDESMVSATTMTEEILDQRDMTGNHSFWEEPRERKPRSTNERNTDFPGSGKMMLSMGFRADCEKCRTRVPGHYNHVIRA